MVADSTESKKYEIAYLVTETVAEDDVVRVVGIVTKSVSDLGGVIDHIEEPKMRKLAYFLANSRNAYFGHTTFQIDSAKIAELRKKLSFEKEILRFLITEFDPASLRLTFRPTWGKREEPVEAAVIPKARPRPEVTPLSPEERQAAIENIDKRLNEMFGGEKGPESQN